MRNKEQHPAGLALEDESNTPPARDDAEKHRFLSGHTIPAADRQAVLAALQETAFIEKVARHISSFDGRTSGEAAVLDSLRAEDRTRSMAIGSILVPIQTIPSPEAM